MESDQDELLGELCLKILIFFTCIYIILAV